MSKFEKIFNKRLRKFHIQRLVVKNKHRERIAKKQGAKIGSSNFTGESILAEDPNEIEVNTKGFTRLGVVLDEGQINGILASLEKLECYDGYRPELGTFSSKEIPGPTQVANYKREEIVSIKKIMDIANDPKILSFVQKFLHGKPTISALRCWWSVKGNGTAEHTQLFHRDVDDYKFIKLFIYLTDVSLDNGPHVYVETSAYDDRFKKIRRLSDTEIEDTYGKDKINYITGKKGEAFLVNTYGIHKGLLPKEGRRLMLQVRYSINEIGVDNYTPIKAYEEGSYDPYVNRLLIK
ncbi:MAG: phytanoyl-CoA dioxygenase family protein [Bacteroidota bacterium]